MIDQNQAKAVRLQSSAVVSAAVITTVGAITAACIQSGWINRPAAGSDDGATPVAWRTTFASSEKPAKRQFVASPPSAIVNHLPVPTGPQAAVLPPETSNRPLLAQSGSWPSTNPLSQLNPPNPQSYERRVDPPKPASKSPFDWSGLTRLFQWKH